MITLTALALAGCLAVASDSAQIRAGDLAPGFPEMAALAPDLAIAPAPAPGVVRLFHPSELRRLALSHGLAAAPDKDLCVKRPVAPLQPETLLEAMRQEFPAARIELLEYSRQPAPQGIVEFPKRGLRAALAYRGTGALWVGSIRYGVTQHFSIWARVTITSPVERVVARTDLRAGVPIATGQLELIVRDEFPVGGPPSLVTSLTQAIGKWPRQTIHAGDPIRLTALQLPQAVRQGDMVKVEVRDGGAALAFQARAESSGAEGQTVYVCNPDSNRRFRARVAGPGRVSLDITDSVSKEVHP